MTNNVYWDNFKKYEKLAREYQGEDYYGLMEEVKKVIIPKQDTGKDSSAVVVFGFSGNGKTTWIREFCKQKDDYVVLSMDEVVRKLSDSLGRRVDGYEVTRAFGEKLDEICSSGKKVMDLLFLI